MGVMAYTSHPSTQRLKKEDCHNLKTILGYMMSLRPTWTTQQTIVSTSPHKKGNNKYFSVIL